MSGAEQAEPCSTYFALQRAAKITAAIGDRSSADALYYKVAVTGGDQKPAASKQAGRPGRGGTHGRFGGPNDQESVGAADPIPDDLLLYRLSRSRECRLRRAHDEQIARFDRDHVRFRFGCFLSHVFRVRSAVQSGARPLRG